MPNLSQICLAIIGVYTPSNLFYFSFYSVFDDSCSKGKKFNKGIINKLALELAIIKRSDISTKQDAVKKGAC